MTLLPTFTPSQSYSSTWSLHGFLLGPGFATGADQHKQSADFSKWKAVIKKTRGANMHNFLWPLSLSALSLHLLPYVFIYPVMWVAVQRQPGSLEHLALMEKGFCRPKRREMKLGLDVGSACRAVYHPLMNAWRCHHLNTLHVSSYNFEVICKKKTICVFLIYVCTALLRENLWNSTLMWLDLFNSVMLASWHLIEPLCELWHLSLL